MSLQLQFIMTLPCFFNSSLGSAFVAATEDKSLSAMTKLARLTHAWNTYNASQVQKTWSR